MISEIYYCVINNAIFYFIKQKRFSIQRTMSEILNIKIPSLLENIRVVESVIDQLREKYKLADDIYGNVTVAVTEAINNAIVHGNKNDKNKNISFRISIDKNNLSFSVEDEGIGFDYHDLPNPTAPENIEKLGGRGIFLIKHLADEVNFLANGSKIQLKFYLNNI